MGSFDFLKRGSSPPPAATGAGQKQPANKKVAGLARIVADKRAQTYDRSDAIRDLAAMKTPEAAEALLKRFTFSIDPSITDQEEKEAAFDAIVAVGKPVVPPIREFCKRAEVLTWPLRILHAILDDEEYRDELLKLAEAFDTEYARNVEPKLQVVAALADVKGDEVHVALERFLDDVNETVRFHAVQSTFAQSNADSIAPLLKLLGEEESVRIKNKICEGFLLKGWKVPEGSMGAARKAAADLDDFELTSDGAFERS
jgi:HEAT repeat protein